MLFLYFCDFMQGTLFDLYLTGIKVISCLICGHHLILHIQIHAYLAGISLCVTGFLTPSPSQYYLLRYKHSFAKYTKCGSV